MKKPEVNAPEEVLQGEVLQEEALQGETSGNAPHPGVKMEKITLFKDNKDYKDDLFVSVNGERFQIQRGVEVEVPDYVAEVIKHSVEQDIIAADTAKDFKG
jgi:hypothetical protein